MIRKLICCSLIAITLFSCSGKKKAPVTDIDVATTFIRAALDNDFKTADEYLLKDETNQQFFEGFKRNHQNMPEAELKQYKSADIVINEIKSENDSVHVVNYTNSYKKEQKTNLKMVLVNGKWLVDLKYTFEKEQ